MAKIEIEREGRSWAIKHDGGYLGHVGSHDEAVGLVRALLDSASDGSLEQSARPHADPRP